MIERPNQVRSADMTYLAMKNGFLYFCRTGRAVREADSTGVYWWRQIGTPLF